MGQTNRNTHRQTEFLKCRPDLLVTMGEAVDGKGQDGSTPLRSVTVYSQ